MKILKQHTSPETAYVVDDYPYGFRLRCKIRYWIETTKNGDRVCTQTTNPKRSTETWNKPKKSTYSDLMYLYLNEDDHVKSSGTSIEWTDLEKFEKFLELGEFDLNEPRIAKLHTTMKIIDEARKHIKVEIRPGRTIDIFNTPKETWNEMAREDEERKEENNKVVSKVLAYATHKVTGGDPQ